MDLQPPDAPLPDLFAAVRRRHPDVDIVLLPPEAPTPEGADADPGEVADEAEVVASLGRAATCADLQWSRVLGGTVDRAAARIGFGPRPGTVVAAARHSARVPPDLAPLDRLEELLAADGWQLRRLAGDAVRLVGHRKGLHLRASYAEASGAFVLEVSGDPLLVGVGPARGLVTR